jgi:predicted transcriptional regulator
MVKTTVYLHEDQAAALRRLARHTGRSQAEIIRDAVAEATKDLPKRRFHALGVGEGTGEDVSGRFEEILHEEWGRKLDEELGRRPR